MNDVKTRLDDFERRASYSPDTVLEHASTGSRYIPVHEFGQNSCDAYWQVRGDVCLLQVWSTEIDPLNRSGLFVRRSENAPHFLNLVAVVSQDAVSQELFEEIMNQFVVTGIPAGDEEIGHSLKELSPNTS